MPLAISPIKLDILPRPKSKTTRTTTIAICQKLIPITQNIYNNMTKINMFIFRLQVLFKASSISSYMFLFSEIDCSLKNFPVPKMDLSILEVSIKPADPSSSIVGKSNNF